MPKETRLDIRKDKFLIILVDLRPALFYKVCHQFGPFLEGVEAKERIQHLVCLINKFKNRCFDLVIYGRDLYINYWP